jgi:hypothetical protein
MELHGIPRNSYRFLPIPFLCNSGILERNWMIKWWVRHASISFNVLIPESNGIPTNSLFVQFRNSRAELDDQMMGKTCFNIIQCSNSGIKRNSFQFLPIPTNSVFVQFRNSRAESDDQMMGKTCFNIIQCSNSGIERNSQEFLPIPTNSLVVQFRNSWYGVS